MARILHLSDLHFSRDSEWFHYTDLEPREVAEMVCEALSKDSIAPEYVAISGDLTWEGQTPEFNLAADFTKTLLHGLSLTPAELLVVAGNHDMTWKIGTRDANKEEQEAAYRAFHHQVFGQPARQDLCAYLVTKRLTLLGIHSASQESANKPTIGVGNERNVARLIKSIKKDPNYNPEAPKVAVSHHHLVPVQWTGPIADRREGLMVDSDAIQTHLLENGFCGLLHGHAHKPGARSIHNFAVSDHTSLALLGAGSFGATARHLPPEQLRHFQVIDVQPAAIHAKWFEPSRDHERRFLFQKDVRVACSTSGAPARTSACQATWIAVSGSMGVGKSTLVGLLQKAIPGSTVVHSPARGLIKQGHPSDDRMNFDDYAPFFTAHLEKMTSVQGSFLIFERTLLDTLAYAEANKNLKEPWLTTMRALASRCAQDFDHYVYLPVEEEVPLKEDGVRNADPKYQRAIDEALRNVLNQHVKQKVIVAKGTPKERLQTVLEAVGVSGWPANRVKENRTAPELRRSGIRLV